MPAQPSRQGGSAQTRIEAARFLVVPPPWDAFARRTIRPIEKVLALPSIYSCGKTVAEVAMTRDIEDDYYQAITAEMKADGINRVPVFVGPAHTVWWVPWAPSVRPDDLVFASGHHRLAIAAKLGLPRILTTDHVSDSQPDCGGFTYWAHLAEEVTRQAQGKRREA